MEVRPARLRLSTAGAIAAAVLAVGGCTLNLSNKAEARNQWQRHYTLAQGGTLDVRNTNGIIRIEPADGNTVEITADRVVQAATDEAARDGLAKFDIRETVAPDHIAIDSSNRGPGVMLNLSRHADYHIRVPQWTNLTLETTNGTIDLAGPRLSGTFHAETTNGSITAVGLENNTTAETTNGAVTLEVTRLGDEGLTVTTTNGAIAVALPTNLKARISARVTNGTISPQGIDLAVSEQSKHRLDGTIGGGGPSIKLETTNGGIQIKGAK